MSQTLTDQNEMLIRKILTALACNNINMGKALMWTDMMSQEQLLKLDKYLQEHNGDITEAKFQEMAGM